MIAFTSARDGNLEIYVMTPDGAAQTNLTNAAGDDFSPTWR
jgi:Tol biopolymer transport system component